MSLQHCHIVPEPAFSLEKKKQLGQFRTSDNLARWMTDLVARLVQPHQSVLDPCIGPNTFFKALSRYPVALKLTGIEIDPGMIDSETIAFFRHGNRQLLIENFLDYPLSETFDHIIVNPPYVRQELIVQGINAKEKAIGMIGEELAALIPPKANLYVYFLIKALLHLKDKGHLVAVIYDSWLYNAFGKGLKEIFMKLGNVGSIYHFKNAVFDKVDVGATVIHFQKNVQADDIAYYRFETAEEINQWQATEPVVIKTADFYEYNFNSAPQLDFDNDFFIPLKNISGTIKRGTAAVINDYFLQPKKMFKESLPIIKDTTRIRTFSVNRPTAYLLNAGKKTSAAAKRYLLQIREQILATDGAYSAVKEKIQTNGHWHKVYIKKPGNFIFNYYLRNNIDFILNEQLFLASDNFYAFNITTQVDAYLAVLNSSFTRLSILSRSRSQGNGLRKIQLYEFKETRVVNLSHLSPGELERLSQLGKQLKKTDRYSEDKHAPTRLIDELLLECYNRHTNSDISLNDLKISSY